MAHHVTAVHGGNDAVEKVQIRATDGASRDLDDGVAWLFDLGVGHAFAADIAFAVPGERLHAGSPFDALANEDRCIPFRANPSVNAGAHATGRLTTRLREQSDCGVDH